MKYKPGDKILYRHPKNSSHEVGKILSIGDEDNYWIEWNNNGNIITCNSIYDIDSDPYVYEYNETTLILFGSNNEK